jgi:hypothetical protein
MKKERQWPEIFVEKEFLRRTDFINKVLRVDATTFNVNFEHPVLGQVVEIFDIFSPELLCLKSVYPVEMQDSPDEIVEIAKDYYNNFLLDGNETYLEYFNPEIGYFLLSRNVKEVSNPFGGRLG